MKINLSINRKQIDKVVAWTNKWMYPHLLVGLSIGLAAIATAISFMNNTILAYGDAESHLNIAKRVFHSITPGAAQLGGIWLPLPHIMLLPFVYFDILWRTGLAGSIVSGFSFVVSSIFLYKTTHFLTKNKVAGFISFLVFALNPNILYIQTTPMTEMVLIMFFILSGYYFIRYIYESKNLMHLIAAGFFGFCASLSRYDGWFLVLFEAFSLMVLYVRTPSKWKELEGKLILYCTMAFFGIALWMLWDYLILGDPFYFTNSQFSAKTQQQSWYSRGELPAYHNIITAFSYYTITSMSNVGLVVFVVGVIGFLIYAYKNRSIKSYVTLLVLLVPFIFNVVTLFLGQSVIFIPHLTPSTFEWRLFNVRYGVMMMPVVAFFAAYLFVRSSNKAKTLLIALFLLQFVLFGVGYSKAMTLADGTEGLSRAKLPDAQNWISKHYDGGLVLIDDYARSISIVRSTIPMQNVIYVGNKYYWEDSFYNPEKYAKWIIMQKDDDVWKGIYDKKVIQQRLYKYFNKVYTSPTILIFKRMGT